MLGLDTGFIPRDVDEFNFVGKSLAIEVKGQRTSRAVDIGTSCVSRGPFVLVIFLMLARRRSMR